MPRFKLGLGLPALKSSLSESVSSDTIIAVATDIHASTVQAPYGTRYPMDSYDKAQDFVDWLKSVHVDILALLGDEGDGSGSTAQEVADIAALMTILRSARKRTFSIYGNHDAEHAGPDELLPLLSMPGLYYSLKLKNKGKALFLNTNFSSTDDSSFYDDGNFTYTDTYINTTQLAWIDDELASAEGPVFVFSHNPMSRDTGANYLKNAATVRAKFEASGKVVGVFSGHVHENRKDVINGIPYYILQAMCEGPKSAGNNAFGLIRRKVTGELTIQGFGNQYSWGIPSTEETFVARRGPFNSQYEEDMARAFYQKFDEYRDIYDAMWVYARSGARERGFFNIAAEGPYDLIPTGAGVTWTDDGGIKSDGVDYGVIKLNPAYSGAKFGRYGFMGFIAHSASTNNSSALGNRDCKIGRSASGHATRFHTGTTVSTTVPNSFPAHPWMKRTEDPRYTKYSNNSLIATVEEAVTAVYDNDFTVLQIAGGYHTGDIGLMYIGGAGNGGRMQDETIAGEIFAAYLNMHRAPIAKPPSLDELYTRMSPPDSNYETLMANLYAVIADPDFHPYIPFVHTFSFHDRTKKNINWQASGLFDASEVNSGALEFVANRHVKSDGSTSYMTVPYNPVTEGLGQNHGMCLITRTAAASFSSTMGNSTLRIGGSGATGGSRAGNAATDSIAITTGVPRTLSIHRHLADRYSFLRNGVQVTEFMSAFTGHTSANIDYCRVTTTYTTAEVAGGLLTDELPLAEQLIAETALWNFFQGVWAL